MKFESLLSLGATVLGALAINACVHEDQVRRDTYDTNYRRAVQLCGKPERAYQDGYNEGYGHARMYIEWADFCAPEARAQAISAYQDGFSAGASNAPVRVEHTIRGRIDSGGRRRSNSGARGNNEVECRFDSDCGGSGWHCRDNECRGFGANGDVCQWNDECVSDHCFGGVCRE